ncbi:homocysteine S-methyltransferase family protein [Frigidibacter sp. RF13]|uniref:homocysteine S-methyltransferase family protein n=1 Tax=Frigidibacter sp. RF13 TaxID=2997340 RepID=UPI00226F0C1E|nr:homocysteine S-methyltransferase family protein [Frigidibacter sp. RF13]MCY1125655.1 homocysteine S-methyltransferase family protein [Frigidibacter sp. RF13]
MAALDLLLATSRPFLADGGLETDLIFNDGFDLPHFASFALLATPEGRAGLERYFDRYLDLAEKSERGFLLDTATWRANAGWAPKLGLSSAEIKDVNREAVRHARQIRARRGWADRILINGCVGPAGDGYAPGQMFTPEMAEDIHRPQLEAFADEAVDLVSAMTMTHVGEAAGVVRAARAVGLPVVISFTVETDGCLPVGTPLGRAIEEVEAATGGAPLYYGINCAHPTHFLAHLKGSWTQRIGCVRANASVLSHAELDEATELDDGDPDEFGHLYSELAARLPGLRAVGGCCGSDHRHVAAAMAAT